MFWYLFNTLKRLKAVNYWHIVIFAGKPILVWHLPLCINFIRSSVCVLLNTAQIWTANVKADLIWYIQCIHCYTGNNQLFITKINCIIYAMHCVLKSMYYCYEIGCPWRIALTETYLTNYLSIMLMI